MEVRCTKLDSVQHDLDLIPNLLEEIDFWKQVVQVKDKIILEKAQTILSYCDTVDTQKKKLISANVKITSLMDKVEKRGRQRFTWSAICVLLREIPRFFL